MPHDWKKFEHQDRMTAGTHDPLMTFLRGNEAGHVKVSLRNQRKTDSQILQILLTASRAWRLRGLDFDVIDVPPKLLQDCKMLGLNAETTGWSGLK